MQRSAHGTVSDVRGITKTYAVVSEVQRDVADTRAIVSDIHRNMPRSQEGVDDQRRLVSGISTTSATEHMFNVAQTHTKLAYPTVNGSNILYLYLAHPVNYLPLRQGAVLDVTN